MAFPTYKQDFESGSTLATACPELTDGSTSPPGWSIDTASNGFTGTHSLLAPIRTAPSLIASNANDTLSGNVSVSAYFRSINGNATNAMAEYRLYGRATSSALTTGYFADMANSGILLFGQVAGSTTFGPIGAGTTTLFPPTNVPILIQLWLSGTSPVTLKACIVRQDTGQFWVNGSPGSWTSTPTYVTGTDSTGGINTGAGLIGVNHKTNNVANLETANYTDDLIYEPSTPQIDVPTFTLTSASPTQQLTAGGFTDPLNGVTWTSSAPSIAPVTSSGMVSALRVGTATITATGKRDGSQTATATVTVASLPVFTYRLPVTIDNTANATSALSYYQVGISLTGAAYTSINTHAKADRSDLRVTDSDGVTPLSFALEGNDTANSAVYLLVKVPYVAAGGTRTIYVYYGNAAAASVSSYATTVGPTTAITGPTDVFTQTDDSPFNANEVAILLKNQGGIHGGGAGLNGKILCWILAGAGSNADRSNGDIVMLSSTDGGVTFPTKTILVTHDATNTAEPRSVVELADGTIILAYSTDTNTNSSAGKAKMYLAKSVNGGVSWTNLGLFGTPINPLTVPWIYNTNVGSCYGRIIEKTPGGDLFLPVYGAITGDAKWHSWLLKCPSGSDPVNGATWVTQGTIAFDNTNQWSETTVIQTTSASNLLAIMRNDVVGDLYQCTSADSGATWTTPARINLPGITVVSFASAAISPELIRLASGNYLLCFGVRYGNDFGSCAAVLSTDGGATWIDRAPFCTTTGYTQALWDGGYPTAVQNADGTICVLGYRNLNNIAICNVFRMVFTEDYIANCNNVYEGCESLGGRWAAVGANATLDAAHVNHGTRAVKIDNSAATGGVNDYATYQAWDTDPAQTNPRVAVSYWSYQTANDSNDGFKTLDATDSVTTPGHARTTAAVLGTASQHLEWYNGTAYQDTGVAVPLNQWAKKTLRANMGPSSLTGQLLVNNVSATSSLGQSFSGAAPVYLHWLGASLGTTHNVIYWIDDLYTHQYAASIPAVTVGAEQSGLSTTASAAITLAPDTVSASAVAPPSRTASAAITLAPDTVAAAAVAAAPGGATATGSFTLRADTVTCTVGPYYTVTPSTAHADPYHATTVS